MFYKRYLNAIFYSKESETNYERQIKTNVKCVNIQNHRSKGKLSFCYISTINTRNFSGYMCALRVFIDVFGEEKESLVIH